MGGLRVAQAMLAALPKARQEVNGMSHSNVGAYRVPGQRPEDGPEPLPKGPAMVCPACGTQAIFKLRNAVERKTGKATSARIGHADKSGLRQPRACTSAARVRLGWFRRCEEPGSHLHEQCKVCGLEWLTAFAEGA